MRASKARCVVLMAVLAVSFGALGAQKPVRLIAEGEDFTVEKGAWAAVPFPKNYYASTFAICFLSRMACLGAPEQVEPGKEAVASLAIDVPEPGDYQVLARFEQPFRFSVEFTLEAEQGGKTVFRETFGLLDDPKIWAFNKHQRVPMQRYSWGGTDNIVWQQKGVAKLARGPARLRLIAGPQLAGKQPRAMAARRHVDLICLTTDTAGLAVQRKKARYLENDGWLVQDGDLFVRITNPKDGLGPCVPIVAPYPSGQHSPYWVHVRDWPTTHVVKGGRAVSRTAYRIAGPRSRQVRADLLAPIVRLDPKKIPDDRYLQPGETSGWIPIGQALDSLNNSIWCPQARYKDRGAKGVDLEIEFAIPDGAGGLKPVRKTRVKGVPGPISLCGFEIPGNVAARPVIRTQLEALEWLAAEVAKFPKRDSPPKRLPFYGLMGFSSATNQDNPLGEVAAKLALALGDNTLTPLRGPWAERLGVPERRAGLVAHWRPSTTEALEKRAADAEKKGHLQRIAVISFGDEIHIPPAKPDDAKFAAWLEARGVDWNGPVKVTADPKHPLYYYARLWAVEAGIAHYADATRYLEKRVGQGVVTGANYSPHANYMVTDLQWVRPFKMRAMTLPWSEDYLAQIPEFSVQTAGYLASGFRAGAKYHKLPIMMYVMPHTPNNTPRDFRLSFYTCIAHGVTRINYFCASPLATAYTENYIATEGLPMWRAVYDATYDAGVFEDYVLDGTVRPAKVGLLLSSVDEILTGDSNFKGAIHNAERKAIYLALRHAQVPVDFITEDDVIDGLAKDVRLIYATQQHLHSKAVKALAAWVEAGGTLVALCGGGYIDEFGKPNPDAIALYGARGETILKDPSLTMILTKQDLPPSTPIDVASWGAGSAAVSGIEVIAWKQKLEPTDGKALGTFATGLPAVVAKAHGKGRAVLFGFLPGQAYLKSALPLRPPDRGATDDAFAHFLPTEMNPRLRAALVDAFLPQAFIRPVECSTPLVETTCIDTAEPARLAVPLMNYTGKPIGKLTVTVRGIARATSVRSVVHGKLKPAIKDGTMTVELPLDVADMLLVDR